MPASIFLIVTLMAAQQNTPAAAPDAGEVIAAMMRKDAERRAEFEGYSGVRTYVLENVEHQKRAEMTVRVICRRNGARSFEVLSEAGWGGARKHVFPKLLEAEATASKPGSGEDSGVNPENYSFQMMGIERIGGRSAYAIEITPKLPKKYLVRGTIWVDTTDYAILRIEGSPAKTPSFFIRTVRFTHSYQKDGSLWLPESDISISDVRIFGPTQLTILYHDYQLGAESARVREPRESRVP
jgi:hypothetical protein